VKIGRELAGADSEDGQKRMKVLERATAPLVRWNERLYGWFNSRSADLLEKRGLPRFVTANKITAARTTLVAPTLFLLSNGFSVLPAACVVVNVTFDYVDGAVARWEKAVANEHKATRSVFAEAASSALSFGVPDLKSVKDLERKNELLESARMRRWKETWGAYFDAIADKVFAIPVWLSLFHAFGDRPWLQIALFSHVSIETWSAYIRTKAYFTEPSSSHWIDLENSQNRQLSTATSSAVVAGIMGKTKQSVSMLGTAFVMIPVFVPLGTFLLYTSLPFAILSVTQKMKPTVVYAEINANEPLGPKTLSFLEQSKGLGSVLIVGVRNNENEATNQETNNKIDSLRLLSAVDYVIQSSELPGKSSITGKSFMKTYGITVIAVPAHLSFEEIGTDPDCFQTGKIVPVKLR